ncbi:hypothetical protein [Sphingomonas sp.]|uniref:hypothetical protein n=1 Tax=Sphingomonas sp. TaxID=28214 RepID=UPI0035B25A85
MTRRVVTTLLIFVNTYCTYYSSEGYVQTQWRYAPISMNIRGLKNGSGWNGGVSLPIGDKGADTYVNWDGCIEERRTVTGTSFNPMPAGATDLVIDANPTSGDFLVRWGPALPGAIFTRKTSETSAQWSLDPVTTTANFGNEAYYTCPTEARLLQTWDDAKRFGDYVDSLKVVGSTYHDIGMLWGARLLSPTGVFATNNNSGAVSSDNIERHLIFMTDGNTETYVSDYAAYGIPWFDRRNVATPGEGDAGVDSEVNARFEALCTAVKNKNITVWVISFGDGSNADTEARLQRCASSGTYYFKAADSAALQTAFTSIATQISQLRLTK